MTYRIRDSRQRAPSEDGAPVRKETMKVKSLICLCISLLLSTLGSNASSGAPGTDARDVYAGLPIEVQLLIADIKLDGLIRNAGAGGEAAQAQKFREAKALLKEALRKYEHYRTGDPKVLSEQWGFNWAPPRPGFPSVMNSPLSVLEHLWIGYDMAAQLNANIMIAPVQYSPEQSALNRSLSESLKFMEKAIRAAEGGGIWAVHWLSGTRLMISAPPEFKPVSPLKDELVRLLKSKPDGSPQGVVFISRAMLSREETALTPERFRESRVEKTRQRFPDMADLEFGESAAGEGFFMTSFAYRYTWEGASIKALVQIRRVGDVVYETKYVAPVESFDRAEADRIIGSLLFR
jgi:hypothetical protein